jgi:hypothetical protein
VTVTENSRLRRRPDVYARDFDGETVLVDLVGGDYFGLDEIGGRAWSGFVAGKTPAEVAGELCRDYDVERQDVLRDLVELARSLVGKGLLSVEGE